MQLYVLPEPQCKDKPDILNLMRRHPSWAAAGLGKPAAAAFASAAAARSGLAGAEQSSSDSEDEDSLEDGGSDDAQDDMQDEVLSSAAAAAAAAAPAIARRPRRARTYTAVEQEIMRELNVSKLANITSSTISTGAARWSVKLCAEGLSSKPGGPYGRELCGESSQVLSIRDLWTLI